MDRFPVEILYVLVFLGIVLFNTVQAMRRRQRQAEQEAAAQREPPPAEDEPREDIWGRPAAHAPALDPAPAPVAAPRPAPPATPRRLHPVRALLRERRDLRRAVVLMMVLGPCRSQDPPERR
jgi:hypothetical protein